MAKITQLPDSSSKSVSVGEINQQDLNEMRGTRDFTPDLSGNEFQHMNATRYDPMPRGYNSEPEPQSPVEPAPEQTVYPDPEPQPESEPDYRQKYGESENEKGEWRRQAVESQQMNNQLMQQLAEITNRLTQPMPGPTGPPPRLFPEKQPGELVTFSEIEQILLNEVLPTIEQRAQLAASQAQDYATARSQRMQPSWDVSSAEENTAINSLRSEIVNFDNRFTATEKNQMVLGKVQLNRSTSGNSFSRPPSAQAVGRVNPVIVDPNRMMRKQTYIESASPTQMTSEPASSDPSSRFQQEFRALDLESKAKTGRPASAAQLKGLLMKHGMQEVNDWNQ